MINFATDGTFWEHAGQILAFQSLWFVKPESELLVVGLTNSASYEAYSLLNVFNILEGRGAQPLSPITLLPMGDFIGTTWVWEQFITPVETTEIDDAAGLAMEISKDDRVYVRSFECGQALGSYTSAGMENISFDMDASSLTCAADSPALQFVQYLNEAISWSFKPAH